MGIFVIQTEVIWQFFDDLLEEDQPAHDPLPGDALEISLLQHSGDNEVDSPETMCERAPDVFAETELALLPPAQLDQRLGAGVGDPRVAVRALNQHALDDGPQLGADLLELDVIATLEEVEESPDCTNRGKVDLEYLVLNHSCQHFRAALPRPLSLLRVLAIDVGNLEYSDNLPGQPPETCLSLNPVPG